jgi:hypothetical protein
MPRWGKIGKQKIEDAGELCPKRMETVDDEIRDLALKFVDKAKADNKPFFLWLNPTRMHIVTHLSPKYEALRNSENGWSEQEAGMAQLDDDVYDGVTYDARLETTGWDLPGFDASNWTAAVLKADPGGATPTTMSTQAMPPISVQAEIDAIAMWQPAPGVTLLKPAVRRFEEMPAWVETNAARLEAAGTVAMYCAVGRARAAPPCLRPPPPLSLTHARTPTHALLAQARAASAASAFPRSCASASPPSTWSSCRAACSATWRPRRSR